VPVNKARSIFLHHSGKLTRRALKQAYFLSLNADASLTRHALMKIYSCKKRHSASAQSNINYFRMQMASRAQKALTTLQVSSLVCLRE
jgi:hypothetical protein